MRSRQVAGTPAQSVSAAWRDISELVVNTLDRSQDIDRADVERAMTAAAGAGRSLIAAGQLAAHPVVVMGDGGFQLDITVISGDKATGVEHNTKPVPGGASVSSWMVHLPAVGAIGPMVVTAAKGDEHLSSDPPTTPAASDKSEASAIDMDRLKSWSEERL